ncbi:MAG: hypothetical protein EPO32_09770 [Anaerolineae bacterium]|nr:MAG: hypothetical protein EPO32_09770 [Anaerolineae bacterium]
MDREFEVAVLNGHRREKLKEFSLSEAMTEKVIQIRASSLQDFIGHLDHLAQLGGSRYSRK